MKRFTVLLLTLCCFTLAFAQQQEQKKPMSADDYKAKQQAFITQRAALTEAEAEAFFPLYFQLQKEKMELQRNTFRKVRKPQGEKLTEEEASQFVDEMADMKIKCDQLEKDYLQKFKEMLPATKLLRVQMAERDFQRELLRDMQKGFKGQGVGRSPMNHFRPRSEKKSE
ncbi:MAG: hypothetical protein J5698_00555 [Bacteroidaceae bacterium]|nr:hypothetical protein [Bacteroidaceae bacterium]MBO4589449.1 hypothetical protein [Bacteroidaceae bacterium]MBR5964215.1 hypothetical protein [Bacteroidaceae bacterium]